MNFYSGTNQPYDFTGQATMYHVQMAIMKVVTNAAEYERLQRVLKVQLEKVFGVWIDVNPDCAYVSDATNGAAGIILHTAVDYVSALVWVFENRKPIDNTEGA